jgi:hypothetical protein
MKSLSMLTAIGAVFAFCATAQAGATLDALKTNGAVS